MFNNDEILDHRHRQALNTVAWFLGGQIGIGFIWGRLMIF